MGKVTLLRVAASQKSVPECPEYLTGAARAEFERVAPLLVVERGLKRIDLTMLAAYCAAAGRFVDAQKKLGTDLLVVGAGRQPVPNPYLRIANRAMEQMVRYGAEFGLSPVSRGRVKDSDGGGEIW